MAIPGVRELVTEIFRDNQKLLHSNIRPHIDTFFSMLQGNRDFKCVHAAIG